MLHQLQPLCRLRHQQSKLQEKLMANAAAAR
jgi:hypothetical protein